MNLKQIYTSQTYLSEADLRHVDLRSAHLFYSNLTDSIGLSFQQLSQAKTLAGCKGLPPDLQKRLETEHPELFD